MRTQAGAEKYGISIGEEITADRFCKHPNCGYKKFSLGYCKMHYTRHRNGSPPMDAPRRRLKGEAVWSEWRLSSDGYVVRSKQYREGGRLIRLHQSEHRVVWEEIHGPLLPGQNIHHKNGVRHDNRPENLELWDTTQPKGQRVEDKLAFAREMFERYAEFGETWVQDKSREIRAVEGNTQ